MKKLSSYVQKAVLLGILISLNFDTLFEVFLGQGFVKEVAPIMGEIFYGLDNRAWLMMFSAVILGIEYREYEMALFAILALVVLSSAFPLAQVIGAVVLTIATVKLFATYIEK